MPFGDYKDFEDCVSKNSDKSDPNAYCGYIKNQVEEALMKQEAREAVSKATEDQAVDDPESLTTPNAGNEPEDTTKDLTSPQGSSREAENPQASGRGELSPTDPAQDQAEPSANPQDQAEPPNAGHQTATEDDENLDNRSEADYKAPEDEFKDKKRDDHQGQASEQEDDDEDKIEYEGESYHKVPAIEYEEIIYVKRDDDTPAQEEDLDYNGDIYQKADDDVLQLDDDYYVKDEEQAPISDIGGSAPTAIDTPELNPIMGEALVIKDKDGVYRKYSVFEENKNNCK
jgi:hypothetical protein